jgi:hypothetical protein
MTTMRLRPAVWVASVLVAGSFGCGPAGADASFAEEPIEEAEQAVEDTECVMMFQKHSHASLRWVRGSNDVITDVFTDYDDPRSWFCLDHVGNLRYRIRTTVQPELYLDAHESCCDHEVVLRELQNTTQTWEIFPDAFDGAVRIRQVSSERYLDAYTGSTNGGINDVVTREYQANDTQRWYLDYMVCGCDGR